jgi:5-hydroxyisourate hydrolase
MTVQDAPDRRFVPDETRDAARSARELSRREFLTTSLGLSAATVVPALSACAAQPSAATDTAASTEGRLTFHGIDTHHGATITSLRVDLSILEGDRYRVIKTFQTIANGRSDGPILAGGDFKVGRYELLMHVDEYYARLGVKLPVPPFLSKVPLRFAVFDASQAFHIPVLFNPWSYSYYRGS